MKTAYKSDITRLRSLWLKRSRTVCTIEYAKKILEKYPKSAYAWVALGHELTAIARYDEARLALKNAEKFVNKDRVDMIYVQLGHLYNEKGNLKTAEKWYKKAVNLGKNDTATLTYLGAVLAKQGNFAEAKKFHRKAIKAATEPVDQAYLNIGLILRSEGKYKEAITYFDKALAVDPEYRAAEIARKDIADWLEYKEAN